MPEFCLYLNCHNLGSSLYQGYCNEAHYKKGAETNFLYSILESHPEIATLKQAREHMKSTSSFRCEACKGLPRASDVYPKGSDPSPFQSEHNPDSRS